MLPVSRSQSQNTGRAPITFDRRNGGHVGLRRHDDLIARADAELPIGQMQRSRAVAQGQRVTAADGRGELFSNS